MARLVGLDFLGARYFSGAQGRFTSPDPLLSRGRPDEPQTWNRYAYALNNPLKYTDPTGLYLFGACSGSGKECKELQQRFKDSLTYLRQARDSHDKKSRECQRSDAALKAYGKFGDKGVTVAFGELSGTAVARTTPMGDQKSFTVTFDPSKMTPGGKETRAAQWLAIDTGHEGTHVNGLTKTR